MQNQNKIIYACLVGVLLLLPVFSRAAGLDSLELDHKSGEYPAPVHLKVLSAFEGKLYYDLSGKNPTKNSSLYKGIIKLPSPKTYKLKFLYENQLGEEKYFGPYIFTLTPPRGFSQELPQPTIPGGVYDSVLIIKFPLLKNADIYYAINDSNRLRKFTGGRIMLDKSTTLYYKAVYSKSLSTDLFSSHYDILLEPPKITLETDQRKFNFEPKLKVKMEKATSAYYSLDPLAPFSKFKRIRRFIQLKTGKHVLRMFAKNLAGMQSEVFIAHITVDNTPPQVRYYVNTRLKAAVLSSNEPGTIFYTTDRSTPDLGSTQYTTPIKLPKNGVIPLRFFAVDTMGNESALQGFRASSDAEPPVIQLSHKAGAYLKPFELTVQCSEACILKYNINGKSGTYRQSHSDSGFLVLKIKNEGINQFKYRAKDEPGNETKEKALEFKIDSKPPSITYSIRKLAINENSAVILKSDEPCRIYYTLNDLDPTLDSPLYKEQISVPPGSSFKYFAIDDMGNKTEILSLSELLNPTITVNPSGGIFPTSVKIELKTEEQEKIIWKFTKDGKPLNKFKIYKRPIELQYSGTYKLSYYLENNENKGIREGMYIVDKNPPQIVPVLEKSLIGNSYTLRFKLNEPAIIRYTLDGSDPASDSANVIGNVLKIDKTKLTIKRKGKQVLWYFAIDRADNISSSYKLNLFSPFVTAQPPPGSYNNILTIELGSQPGNIIYYSNDSISLSAKSPVYKEPIIVTTPQELWFYAMDITGYFGPIQRAKYNLNFPPEAAFSSVKEFNFVEESVVFDARLSIDRETKAKDLIFRWDFDGDGIFDSPRVKNSTISHRYNKAGEYKVTLEVEDNDELKSTVNNIIKIYKVCPKDMVTLTIDSLSFCMDKFEWPNDQKQKVLSSVNWAEASMMCIEKGKRLCSSKEWNSACMSRWDYFFSYGNKYQPGTCNTQGKGIVSPKKLPDCKTEEGVYNLIGNLWEWVSDIENNAHLIMGGSYQQASSASCELSFPIQISTKSKEVGFRCCK